MVERPARRGAADRRSTEAAAEAGQAARPSAGRQAPAASAQAEPKPEPAAQTPAPEPEPKPEPEPEPGPGHKPARKRRSKAAAAEPAASAPSQPHARPRRLPAVPTADNDSAMTDGDGEPRRGWWQRTFG